MRPASSKQLQLERSVVGTKFRDLFEIILFDSGSRFAHQKEARRATSVLNGASTALNARDPGL